MSTPAHAIASNATQSVTTISANARVDYILRFSKHAVLVVDQDEDVYSQIASHFLGSLANDHNAAFIAISPKLNDIQIRCRIVEQLFIGTLFDPEVSLAVSLINLVKQEKQHIDIVIEHAQYASLQILHELCQLADIAKKADLAISVLMLGTPQTGVLLANNKSIFNNKISIISGETGQLLALNAKVFKVKVPFFKITRQTKWLFIFISFVISMALTGFWLLQQDAFSLKTKLGLQDAKLNSPRFINANSNATLKSLAANSDILLSLMTPNEQQQAEVAISLPAQPSDIMAAITELAENNETLTAEILAEKAKRFTSYLDEKAITANITESISYASGEVKASVAVNASSIKTSTDRLNTQATDSNKALSDVNTSGGDEKYFMEAQTGFVIQLAGFTELSFNDEFMADLDKINIKRYNRLLNEQVMLMLTSEIYPSHLAAEQAMTLLPVSIKDNKPWIKSVEAIKNEINAYQRSQ